MTMIGDTTATLAGGRSRRDHDASRVTPRSDEGSAFPLAPHDTFSGPVRIPPEWFMNRVSLRVFNACNPPKVRFLAPPFARRKREGDGPRPPGRRGRIAGSFQRDGWSTQNNAWVLWFSRHTNAIGGSGKALNRRIALDWYSGEMSPMEKWRTTNDPSWRN